MTGDDEFRSIISVHEAQEYVFFVIQLKTQLLFAIAYR